MLKLIPCRYKDIKGEIESLPKSAVKAKKIKGSRPKPKPKKKGPATLTTITRPSPAPAAEQQQLLDEAHDEEAVHAEVLEDDGLFPAVKRLCPSDDPLMATMMNSASKQSKQVDDNIRDNDYFDEQRDDPFDIDNNGSDFNATFGAAAQQIAAIDGHSSPGKEENKMIDDEHDDYDNHDGGNGDQDDDDLDSESSSSSIELTWKKQPTHRASTTKPLDNCLEEEQALGHENNNNLATMDVNNEEGSHSNGSVITTSTHFSDLANGLDTGKPFTFSYTLSYDDLLLLGDYGRSSNDLLPTTIINDDSQESIIIDPTNYIVPLQFAEPPTMLAADHKAPRAQTVL